MDEPLWLSGAAIAASLAGLAPAEAALGFAPEAAEALARCLARFAAVPAAERAGALESARIQAMTSTTQRHPRDADDRALGASWMAAALASLPRAERAALARAIDGASLADVARARPSAADATAAHLALALASRRLGRMPDAGELGRVVRAAAGDERAEPALVAVARSLRARGRAVQAPRPPNGGAG